MWTDVPEVHQTGCPAELCVLCFVPIEALKESFIKAIGTGLGFNLQRLEFHLSSEAPTQDRVLRQSRMYLDEEEETDWMFEVSPAAERRTVGGAVCCPCIDLGVRWCPWLRGLGLEDSTDPSRLALPSNPNPRTLCPPEQPRAPLFVTSDCLH